jgi:hypothetical protein
VTLDEFREQTKGLSGEMEICIYENLDGENYLTNDINLKKGYKIIKGKMSFYYTEYEAANMDSKEEVLIISFDNY